MSGPYGAAISDGLATMREWLAQQPAGYVLPDDPWKLPKDCPIWRMGLSLAQASGIIASVRRS